MKQRFVIGIDSSTQSTKAIVWDESGNPVREGRAPISMKMPQPLHVEQSSEEWWTSFTGAIQEALRGLPPDSVEALAISNQRETVAFLDAQGRSLHDAIVWMDQRAMAEVQELVEQVGRKTLHHTTGKPVDIAPVLYRLRWMAKHRPEVIQRTRHILDVQGYLVYRLTGAPATSWTSADPFGTFDIRKKQWASNLLDAAGIDTALFPPCLAPGEVLGRVTSKVAKEFGLRPGTPVVAAGGDGQCAGLGVNAIAGGRAYLNLGTAQITGASSSKARFSNYWRTLISPTGSGYFLESVQRAGAFFINWFVEQLGGAERTPEVFSRLEQEASQVELGSEGILVSTYLAGCMDPHWNADAQGAFLGLRAHHTQAHLYRASLEALTLESARALKAMAQKGVELNKINVIGGGAQSRLWMHMIADATGLPAQRSLSNEASSLGAAISAAVGAGWYSSFEEAANEMTNEAETFEPNPAVAEQWEALSDRQRRVYAITLKA
ncbi:MAG: FGGY-family carbohydrate kinase [bacterium]